MKSAADVIGRPEFRQAANTNRAQVVLSFAHRISNSNLVSKT